MVHQKTIADDGQHRPGFLKLLNGIEIPVLADQSLAAVPLLQRLGQHVRGRTQGATRMEPRMAISPSSASMPNTPQRRHGGGGSAIVIVALQADPILG